MTGLTWIISVICVAGCHLSAASPVLHAPQVVQVVQVGQKVSLTCNLTSSVEVTWYRLRSQQLLPLLTVSQGRIEQTVNNHRADSRITSGGDMEKGLVSLEIVEAEEMDTGLYFCTWRCAEIVCVTRGIHLTVNGLNGESYEMKQPCWSLGICVLPGLLSVCFILITGFYLCSGKPAACCCNTLRRNCPPRAPEDASLHYSSLKHADRPRPSAPGGTGLAKNEVTYSTVASCK